MLASAGPAGKRDAARSPSDHHGQMAPLTEEQVEGYRRDGFVRLDAAYLCHPFLVHAAQPNRGSTVRFLSQPAVPWKTQPAVPLPA